MVRKILVWLAFIVLAVAAVLMVLFIYWSSENPRVLEFREGTTVQTVNETIFKDLPVRPKEIDKDQAIILRLNYCKLKDVHGTVSARLVGETVTYNLTWPDDSSPARCMNNEVPIAIPDGTAPDEYYLEFEVDYHVNPLKTPKVLIQSNKFEVKG